MVRTCPHLSTKCPPTEETQEPDLSVAVRSCPQPSAKCPPTKKDAQEPDLSAPVRSWPPDVRQPKKTGTRLVRTCPHLSADLPQMSAT